MTLLTVGLVATAQTPPPQNPARPPAQNPPASQQPPTNPANPAQQPATPGSPDDQKYKLAVDVELVNVVATVLDEGGKYMDGLRKEDFKILGRPGTTGFIFLSRPSRADQRRRPA